ncbi:MAG: pyridoxamine 5'-phosphate oxidase family protein [Candidatus Aenigmarchaeota archaeon]|nr:pyridoxamine 5'-phosphate oxidase family protein [Candidatus Aenigmarchaeota archaeon]
MRQNPKKLAKSYMENVKLMSMATVSKNKPWCATIFYAFDENFDIYFLSRYYRNHSRHIEKNNSVAGTIAKQHKTFGAPTMGLQFAGSAKMLHGEELKKAYAIFTKRFPAAKKELISWDVLQSKKQPVRLYKISVKKLVLHDEVHFTKEKRRVVVK